ncbi:cellulose synthase [Shinella zoogloeoides]|uniref:cellulose synthase n=1 Tax=Shinella zoogloeoides TaxID=352475 RepID=UPI00273FF07A|nr:cellulose synthase [Shinella zoogloeoides]WLR93311.1 cellulose synthase [Shinella zoogloeoides]
MKSILMAFALISAGAASVAGLSFGVPGDLMKDLPRLGTGSNGQESENGGVETGKQPRLEVAQLESGQAVQPSGGAEIAERKPAVDESALRYFAARGDTARLNAEIARLRALYPTWIPPENPLAVPENEDRQLEEMWALYSQSRYADVRAAIARRQQEDAQWTPPADLVERLDIAEKRAALVAASNAGKPEEVVRIGAETPSLLTCSDADVLWRVAEAFFKTDRVQRAKDAYGYMLDNCTEGPVRVATVQKASTVLGYADMQDLLARERTGADGVKEFEAIRNDLARRFVGEGDEDPAITVSPAYLKIVEKLVADEGLASDALLLGWYHLRRDQNALAEPFFRKARAAEDSASASQGLALILLARKMPAEAEEAMYAWRTSSDQAMQTYLAATANLLALDPLPKLEPKVLNRIAGVTLEEKHPETGEQFGWYALAMNQPRTAEEWFAQVLKWKTDYEPAAYGLGVARLRLEDGAGLAAVKQAWGARSERIARLGEEDTSDDAAPLRRERQPRIARTERRVPVEEMAGTRARVVEEVAVRPERSERTARRVEGAPNCRTTRDPSGLSPANALALGWCLMEINRPMEAAQAFEAALAGGGSIRSDAAYGQSLAYLRAGLTSEAAVAATKGKLDSRRGAELQVSILTDRAVSSFRAKRFRETLVFLDQRSQVRAEPVDLMVLRAYSYKNLGMRADAYRLFEALGETGRQDAIRALAEMRAEQAGRQ